MNDIRSNSPDVRFYADDFAMTHNSSARILECAEHGCLDGVSVMPNGCFADEYPAVRDAGLEISIHLNIVEGKAVSSEIRRRDGGTLLTDADGYFKNSFTGLFALSHSASRKELAELVYEEFKAQINTVTAILPANTGLILSSHQHVHMIPLIFRTLMKLIADEGMRVDYLRIPDDPFMPYVKTPSLYFTYSPLNIAKQIVLKLCHAAVRKDFAASKINTAIFCGIVFSGRMDCDRVKRVLPHFCAMAKKQGRDVELLFHPGGIEEGEPLFDPKKVSFQKFYFSKGRKADFDALHRLKKEDFGQYLR